jgi:hypothetical protein
MTDHEHIRSYSNLDLFRVCRPYPTTQPRAHTFVPARMNSSLDGRSRIDDILTTSPSLRSFACLDDRVIRVARQDRCLLAVTIQAPDLPVQPAQTQLHMSRTRLVYHSSLINYL